MALLDSHSKQVSQSVTEAATKATHDLLRKYDAINCAKFTAIDDKIAGLRILVVRAWRPRSTRIITAGYVLACRTRSSRLVPERETKPGAATALWRRPHLAIEARSKVAAFLG